MDDLEVASKLDKIKEGVRPMKTSIETICKDETNSPSTSRMASTLNGDMAWLIRELGFLEELIKNP